MHSVNVSTAMFRVLDKVNVNQACIIDEKPYLLNLMLTRGSFDASYGIEKAVRNIRVRAIKGAKAEKKPKKASRCKPSVAITTSSLESVIGAQGGKTTNTAMSGPSGGSQYVPSSKLVNAIRD